MLERCHVFPPSFQVLQAETSPCCGPLSHAVKCWFLLLPHGFCFDSSLVSSHVRSFAVSLVFPNYSHMLSISPLISVCVSLFTAKYCSALDCPTLPKCFVPCCDSLVLNLILFPSLRILDYPCRCFSLTSACFPFMILTHFLGIACQLS